MVVRWLVAPTYRSIMAWMDTRSASLLLQNLLQILPGLRFRQSILFMCELCTRIQASPSADSCHSQYDFLVRPLQAWRFVG
jgi:hypothetical protein